MENLTYIMPFRIDCEERSHNLYFTLDWLKQTECMILLLEADSFPKFDRSKAGDNILYDFVKDDDDIFYRTKYINKLMRKAETVIVAVWDTDIITDYSQINETTCLIVGGCTIAYPYSGEYVMLSDTLTKLFMQRRDINELKERSLEPVFKRPFCGGAFLVDKKRYLSIGGENENFYGWGPEDAERLRRVQIMGHKVSWLKSGQAYHLFHPRKECNSLLKEKLITHNREELIRVCNMDRLQLSSYIINNFK